MKKHINLMMSYKSEHTALMESRKHTAWYIKGIRGASKIRINPGNIGGDENVKRVVEACRLHKLPIRKNKIRQNAYFLLDQSNLILYRPLHLYHLLNAPNPDSLFESIIEKTGLGDVALYFSIS